MSRDRIHWKSFGFGCLLSVIVLVVAALALIVYFGIALRAYDMGDH
jgi:hypothetical protein